MKLKPEYDRIVKLIVFLVKLLRLSPKLSLKS